ncbi:MAG: hypothetical protein ABH919_03935 [bacterium]
MFKYLNKGISTPIAIAIILFSAFFLVGGAMFWQYSEVPKEDKIVMLEEKIIYKEIDVACCGAPPSYKTIKIGLKENLSSGWETLTVYEYDGYKIGFSIDYPSEYKVYYGAISDSPACKSQLIVKFSSLKKREIPIYGEKEMITVDIDSCARLGMANTYQEWIDLQKMGRYPVESEENIVIDNKPAIKLTKTVSRTNHKELIVYTYINRDEKIAHEITADIDFEEQNVYLPIFDQMLSTLRFLE